MRIVPAVLVAISVLAGGAAEAGVLDRLKAGETLKLGFREDAEPYSYRGAGGNPTGYSVALCDVIVRDLKKRLNLPDLKVEFVPVESESRVDMIQDGTIDLMCGATSATLERREKVDFSIPTFIDGASLIYRSDGPNDFDGLAGHRVGVRSGTTTEETLKASLAKYKVAAEVVSVTDHKDGLRRLQEGDITAYFADQSILLYLLLESGAGDKLKLSDRFFTLEPYALPLPRGDDDFRLFVDRTLSRLYRSGDISGVFEKSFGKATPSKLVEALFLIAPLPD